LILLGLTLNWPPAHYSVVKTQKGAQADVPRIVQIKSAEIETIVQIVNYCGIQVPVELLIGFYRDGLPCWAVWQAVDIAQHETEFRNVQNESGSAAAGIMQYMPDTFAQRGCGDIWNPEDNIRCGVRDVFNGNQCQWAVVNCKTRPYKI